MPLIRATVILRKLTDIPEDAARNVWHFNTGPNPPGTYTTKVGEALEAFYDGISGGLGRSVQRNAGTLGSGPTVEMATVNFGTPGAGDDVVSELFATRIMGLTNPPSGTSLPSECAVALSFRGNVDGLAEEEGNIRPKARRRGRIFLGPVNTGITEEDGSTGELRVLAGWRTVMLNSYNALVNRLGGADSPNVQHVVYSPTTGAMFPVVAAHVDDAFDTIRSRGEKALSRSETAVTQPAL